MTNEDILQRYRTVQQAIEQDVFSTTKIKYALTSNAKRLEKAVEPYQEEMESLREEYEEELTELQEEQQALREQLENTNDPERQEEIREQMQDLDAPKGFQETRQELLEMEVEAPEPYNVADRHLDDEGEVDIRILYSLDWMFVDALDE